MRCEQRLSSRSVVSGKCSAQTGCLTPWWNKYIDDHSALSLWSALATRSYTAGSNGVNRPDPLARYSRSSFVMTPTPSRSASMSPPVLTGGPSLGAGRASQSRIEQTDPLLQVSASCQGTASRPGRRKTVGSCPFWGATSGGAVSDPASSRLVRLSIMGRFDIVSSTAVHISSRMSLNKSGSSRTSLLSAVALDSRTSVLGKQRRQLGSPQQFPTASPGRDRILNQAMIARPAQRRLAMRWVGSASSGSSDSMR
mmetsp:Transcript_37887/g.85268  ORF Transcript_37887/g.85268 Transcript_37887/m.85268 type:complete len:254 (-) Transcript_37887:12-773(-)